jgi:hypothetical protein
MNIRAHIVAQILLHVSLSQYQYQYHYTFLSASIVTPLPTPRCLNISLHLGGSCTKSLIVAYIIVDALVNGRRRRRDNRRYFEHHPAEPTRLELEDTPPTSFYCFIFSSQHARGGRRSWSQRRLYWYWGTCDK